jgi:hypothetical protein
MHDQICQGPQGLTIPSRLELQEMRVRWTVFQHQLIDYQENSSVMSTTYRAWIDDQPISKVVAADTSYGLL